MKNFYNVQLAASGSLYEERNKHAILMERIGIERYDAYVWYTNFLDGIINWRVRCTDDQLTLLLLHGGILIQDPYDS